jgi:hypothetical protein
MRRGLVQDALARAAQSGGDPLAVATSDPILFALGRRRARRALYDAERATALADNRHVARLAFLFASGAAGDVAFDDVEGVSRAFSAAGGDSPPGSPRGPWLTLGLLGALLASAAAVSLIVWLRRPFDPRKDAVGHALGDELPAYIVSVSHDAAARPLSASSSLHRAIGDDGARAFDELLQSMAGVARDADASDRYFVAVGAMNGALDRAHAPYFLDGDLLGTDARPWPMVYSFYVEREDVATSDASSHPIRVVFVWRLDTLNVRQPYLGYTHPGAGAAIVLLDQSETELIERVLPALRVGESVGLVDEASLAPDLAWQKDLETRAGEVVRAYFAGDADAARLTHIGELIARRRAIVKKWKNDLPLVGVELNPPRRLIPDADYSGELRLKATKASLEEWDDIHDDLLSSANVALFEKLRDRFARSTERHEVQHRIDYGRGLVPVPARIAERLGLDNALDPAPGSYAARCRDETSAYLAQMAEPTDSPTLTLMLLSHFLFDRREWGTAYSCASVTIFELVSTALRLPEADVPLVRYGSVQREALARRFIAMTDHPAGELRDAAKRAWEQAYASPLAKVTTREAARHTAWRH